MKILSAVFALSVAASGPLASRAAAAILVRARAAGPVPASIAAAAVTAAGTTVPPASTLSLAPAAAPSLSAPAATAPVAVPAKASARTAALPAAAAAVANPKALAALAAPDPGDKTSAEAAGEVFDGSGRDGDAPQPQGVFIRSDRPGHGIFLKNHSGPGVFLSGSSDDKPRGGAFVGSARAQDGKSRPGRVARIAGWALSLPMKAIAAASGAISKATGISPGASALVLAASASLAGLIAVGLALPISLQYGLLVIGVLAAVHAQRLVVQDQRQTIERRLADVVKQHEAELMAIPGVVAVKATSAEAGRGRNYYVQIEVTRLDADILDRLPKSLDGFDVGIKIVHAPGGGA